MFFFPPYDMSTANLNATTQSFFPSKGGKSKTMICVHVYLWWVKYYAKYYQTYLYPNPENVSENYVWLFLYFSKAKSKF